MPMGPTKPILPVSPYDVLLRGADGCERSERFAGVFFLLFFCFFIGVFQFFSYLALSVLGPFGPDDLTCPGLARLLPQLVCGLVSEPLGH